MVSLSVCIAVGPGETIAPLRCTIASVLQQTCPAVEVVVKTVGQHLADEVRELARAKPSSRLTLLTGPDAGIYDAFNICTLAATGSHVMFLGCGDMLADSFVAEDLCAVLAADGTPSILYGIVLIANSAGEVFATFDNSCFHGERWLLPWRNPCHSQGLVYSREWLQQNPFSTEVGPLADLVHTHQHHVREVSRWVDRPLAVFRMGGVSNRSTPLAMRARLRGFLVNCKNFRLAAMWRLVTYAVWRIAPHLRRP